MNYKKEIYDNYTLHLIKSDKFKTVDVSVRLTKPFDKNEFAYLKLLEKIIKEGRKFGTFLTIASQRPSDISDTIISQLHNYFIHRLVNEEDLRKIYRTIAFSDKSTNEMIPILPAGGCVFAGLASNFPVLARISILPDENQPQSENVDIRKIWY